MVIDLGLGLVASTFIRPDKDAALEGEQSAASQLAALPDESECSM
jgi:hypothetical protein